MESEPTVDAKLSDASLLQYAFKNETVRSVAVAIAAACAAAPGDTLWPDEIDLPELAAEDKNAIGLSFKNLARWKMIERIETQHRRSTSKTAKGRTVFPYRIINLGLLKVFLQRNGAALKPKQAELGI